ncbi:MAG: serine hydrolase [bacterium]|nr:MAG: serine hydrolase [bacterium]
MKHISIIFVFVVLFALSLTFTAVFSQIQFQNQSEIFTDPNIELYNQFRNANTFVPYDSTMLDSFIIAKMNQYHIPGLQAIIVKDDQLIWKGAFGYANIAKNRLVTDSTLFFLASISKPVTATALMQLWEEGLFGLDDDVNNYLPFQVRNPTHPNTPITFRMLLTHTSSIHDNYWLVLDPLFVWGYDSPIELDSFLVNYLIPGGSYYYSSNYNSGAPGTQYDYSNVGAALIGYLVETISNNSFEQYCQDSIFIPLGMNETSWFQANLDTTHIAMPYYYIGGNHYPYGHSGEPHYPAGQLRTSATQFSRFLRAFIQMGRFDGIRILDSTTVNMMTTVQHPAINPTRGLIWHILPMEIPTTGSRILCAHGGSSHGARTTMAYTLKSQENVGIIVLTNGEADEVLEIILEIFAYGLLYDNIYAHNIEVNSTFMRPGTDTLTLNTEFVNPNNHNFTANAIIRSIDSVYTDSIPLFDDGTHGDLQAGDGIWGNFISPLSFENEFMIGISTTDLDSGEYFILHDLTRFTTIGPLVVDHFEIPSHNPNNFTLKLFLRNDGANATAIDITAKVSTTDTNVTNIRFNNQSFGNLAPGQIKSTANYLVETQNNPGTIDFNIDISSEGWEFWSDSLVYTGISVEDTNIPKQYRLSQNYPNPFNPVTKIEFSIPKSEFVTLKVYNILGEEVATLVSERIAAGSYKYDWDASLLASGVYLYRIQAGEFQQIKKMVLIK